ncbi:MAG: DUF3800 domain-containing protein [Terriglobales bacterium]
MIHCFLDDSGKESDAGNRFVTMAGYLALDRYWMIFSEVWYNLLLKHGISWVHMRDLIPLQGEYAKLGWDTTKRDEVLADFIKAIKISELTGFGVGIDADAWREIPKQVTKKHGNAQEFCFVRVLRQIVDRLKIAGPADHVSIHFDSDQHYTPARFKRFSEVKERDEVARAYLSSISFCDPKKFRPLQAADLLAWETRKDLVQRTGGFESTPRWKEFFESKIWERNLPDYSSEFWTQDEIRKQIIEPFAAEHKKQA